MRGRRRCIRSYLPGSVKMITELTAPAVGLIDRLEAGIMSALPKADVQIFHHFSPGIYRREMRAPALSVITGRRHRTRHLNIVERGALTVINEQDGSRRLIEAPAIFFSEPGTRRAAIVHEDLVWITVHETDETDVARLESALVEPHDNPLLENITQQEVLPCRS